MFLYFIDEYDICLLCVRSYYFIFLMLALCAKKKKKIISLVNIFCLNVVSLENVIDMLSAP